MISSSSMLLMKFYTTILSFYLLNFIKNFSYPLMSPSQLYMYFFYHYSPIDYFSSCFLNTFLLKFHSFFCLRSQQYVSANSYHLFAPVSLNLYSLLLKSYFHCFHAFSFQTYISNFLNYFFPIYQSF